MTVKKSARVLCLICCMVCLFYCTIPSAYAFDPASAIVGTGALASLGLGEIAAFILAGFGVWYGSQHLPALGEQLEVVLNEAAQAEIQADLGNAEATAQITGQLGDWLRDSAAGRICIESAPAWIQNCIDYWASAFSTNEKQLVVRKLVPVSGTSVPANSFQYFPYFGSGICFDHATFYYPCYYSNKHYVVSGVEYNDAYYCAEIFISFEPDVSLYYNFGSGSWRTASYVTVNGHRYYYKDFTGYVYESEKKALVTGRDLGDVSTTDFVVSVLSGTAEPQLEETAISPDIVYGGFGSAVGQVGVGSIGVPDIAIPGSESLGVSVGAGVAEGTAVYEHALAKALAGELSIPGYWDLVGVASPVTGVKYPTAVVSDVATGEAATYPITDQGIGEDIVPVVPSGDYTLDLKDFFPFCIPFDIYDFFSILAAEPEAPQFEWDMEIPMLNYTHHWEIDLSEFDEVAQIVRGLFCLLFIVGLGAATGKFIKW